ncbi:hypothetical protein NS506_00983 [Nocardia seriolae]|uniref:Uncharacterized protein n=2 Tax=Nocardia seriolae TaxID=37332 RepID=A0ABC9YMZ2_9NOCA|nr:hypothetical protein [Nocardia seriolae]APA95057.1 hypothetical protein NS506_00983 [Nocardia seriolae]OJF83282.1 hypothetical protein NS14008_34435 [Nocardia seriolae]BAW10627.1 conserved hypothetical protein [Nocardia seriolae]GAM44942.1 hypothetical protein NS07_v2contig00009-0100 [Nocardia seriolae]GAP26867.1 hypothetical protein NSK11_contig00011-0004 [Nocardia seriolae]
MYAAMIRDRGRGDLHRYYRVEGGNHVDGLYDTHPNLLRPMLPCFRSASTALESWTAAGQLPTPDATLARTAVGDPAATCPLGN